MRLKLQAQIAELQLQQKQIEAKATMRLYILLNVLTSLGLAIYWKNREVINRVLSGIKIKAEKIFTRKEIAARSGTRFQLELEMPGVHSGYRANLFYFQSN